MNRPATRGEVSRCKFRLLVLTSSSWNPNPLRPSFRTSLWPNGGASTVPQCSFACLTPDGISSTYEERRSTDIRLLHASAKLVLIPDPTFDPGPRARIVREIALEQIGNCPWAATPFVQESTLVSKEGHRTGEGTGDMSRSIHKAPGRRVVLGLLFVPVVFPKHVVGNCCATIWHSKG